MKIVDEIMSPDKACRVVECEKHGEYESRHLFRSAWTGCPGCAEDAEAAKKAEHEARMRQAAHAGWLRKIDDACIPYRFQDRNFENFVAKTEAQQRALAASKSYAEGFDEVLEIGRCALFLGKPGTGKTHLSVAIAMHIMRHNNRSALFTTVARVIRRVKETWRNDSEESERSVLNLLIYPDLLILDEVGVQYGTEAEKLILFEIMNARYERRLPTILLSNLDANGVKSYLGERVFDRLREDGGISVIFDWDSHRVGGVAHA